MERIEELCCYYVALLRCVGLVHQNHHWLSKGKNFYGNHLLFERIYKTAVEDADLAAEKFVGLFGSDALSLNLQAQLVGQILKDFSHDEFVVSSMNIEKKFLEFSESFYKAAKDEDKLSLGLDDMVMSIASNREGAVYLLKQTSDGDDMNGKMAARVNLLKRVKKAQAQAGNPAMDTKKLQSLLMGRLAAVVPSYVTGRYDQNSFTVNVSYSQTGALTVMGHAILPVAIQPEVERKIEDNFKAYALSLLPQGMQQTSIIGMGFTQPPSRR